MHSTKCPSRSSASAPQQVQIEQQRGVTGGLRPTGRGSRSPRVGQVQRLAVCVHRHGAATGLQVRARGLRVESRHVIVMRELHRHLVGMARVQFLEDGRDVLVQHFPFAGAEAVVEVLAEHLVAKAKQRDAQRAEPLDARFADQPVLAVEFLREDPQQLPLVELLQSADHLHREHLAFDARHGEQFLHLLADARDAFLEHAFDARGQRVPVERWAGDPATLVVLHEIAPFMHVAQQLGREQRVSARSIVQLVTKLGVESIGFGVDQRVDEEPGLAGHLVVQRDGHVSVLALDFGHDLGQRVSRFVACVRQFLAAIRADDEDAALLDAASQVEQQAGRRFVDPVHVVEDQHQRPLARHLQQHGRNLLEDAALFGHGRRRGCRGIRDSR